MSDFELNLIALDIRKWDLEFERLNVRLFYVFNDEEQISNIELTLTDLPEMVEEFLSKFRLEGENFVKNSIPENGDVNIVLANETFLNQKLSNYFKRVLMELNNPRRKKGQSRMIYSTHMDVYNENQDISFLPEKLRFQVVLNWVRKYYDKEDYPKALEPLRKLIQIKPDYGIAYKWLARSLKKCRKFDEATRYYEKYAEVDQSLDAFYDLAKSYRKGKQYEQSMEIYNKILKDNPDDKEAQIGIAQIQYATNKNNHLKVLDKIYKMDKEWVRTWLKNEFNFRIYVSPKTLLSPIQATKYLGLDKVFELTQKAFQNDIPSHFNPTKARMNFYKEELDNWAYIYNRYKLGEEKVILHPELIDVAALTKSAGENGNEADDQTLNPSSKGAKTSSKLEEILAQIRETKELRKVAEKYQTRNATARNSKSRKKKAQNNSNKVMKTANKN
jgi:tetratricopeptide (TPR) repeat protein